MKLSDRQALFAELVAKLILWAAKQPNMRVRLAQAYDPLNSNSGRSTTSLHRSRLAIDLVLDIYNPDTGKWEYQRTTEAYAPLGKHWKSMHELCEWGGDNGRRDGNHFSVSYAGRW